VEQLIALSGAFVLREGGDQLHHFQSPVDLLGGRGRVTERLAGPLADPGDLKIAFVTAKKNDLDSCARQGTNLTHLLSKANRS